MLTGPSQENSHQNTGFFNSDTLGKEIFVMMMLMVLVVVVAELCDPPHAPAAALYVQNLAPGPFECDCIWK